MTCWLRGLSTARRLCIAFVLASALSGAALASDRDVDGALKAMAGKIADVRKSCDEPVAVEAHEVALSDRVTGVHVVLKATPCLGWFGRYDYLLVRNPAGVWQTIQDGGPGALAFRRRPGQRVAEITIQGLMGCTTILKWSGAAYRQRASKTCGEVHKPSGWLVLESVIRTRE